MQADPSEETIVKCGTTADGWQLFFSASGLGNMSS